MSFALPPFLHTTVCNFFFVGCNFFWGGVCVCVSFEVFAEYLPFSFSSLHVLNLKPRSEVGRKLQQG